jgi:HEAT repeat protein
VRDGAAFALGHFPQTTDETVAALIGALQDEGQRVRNVATQSLGWLGEQAKAAVPALAAIYQDRERSPADVGAAAHALRLIDAQGAAKLGINPPRCHRENER